LPGFFYFKNKDQRPKIKDKIKSQKKAVTVIPEKYPEDILSGISIA